MTPSREPYSGFHTYGMIVERGSLTILIARFMSKSTGISQNTTSRSVIAKSWIIVDAFTETAWLDTSTPSRSATWYSRYGSLKL